QLLLGGDNGLRGYPLRYQAGDALALFTLEQRFYTDWQPLKLVNVGAAVFFDAGRAWGQDPYAAAPARWLAAATSTACSSSSKRDGRSEHSATLAFLVVTAAGAARDLRRDGIG